MELAQQHHDQPVHLRLPEQDDAARSVPEAHLVGDAGASDVHGLREQPL